MSLIDLTKKLIEIPSVSRQQTDIANFIASLVDGDIREFSCKGKPCGKNVIAISEPDPGEPFILLNGHHDTVAQAEGWSTDPFMPFVQGDKIYGLGALDMKAGLAIIILLYIELREKMNLIFTAAGDEETDSVGSFALLDEKAGPVYPYLSRIAGTLVAEPTNEKVMLGARGRYALKLVVHGRAAHGARPYLGINAVEKAAEVVTALKHLPIDSHPNLGPGSYCILGMNGGTGTLSVPDRCEMIVDRHITRPMAEEDVIGDFRNVISDIDVSVDVDLVEREVPFLKPYARSATEPFVRHFLNSLELEHEIIYGRSVGDYNIFGNLVPTIVYGPRGENHHSPDEFVYLSSIERVYERLRSWLEKSRKDLSPVGL